MKLHGAAILIAALLLLPLSAFAADEAVDQPAIPSEEAPGEAPAEELPDDLVSSSPFLPGEQTIGIAAGLHIPAFILPVTGGGKDNLKLGGSFAFSYQYFVARGFSIGGNLAAAFNTTIGGSSLFVLPLGATASFWWTKLPFEFSVYTELGAYMMRENGEGMFGPFVKPGVGVYWRMSPEWSIGLQTALWFIPEIHYGSYSSLTQYGGFVETSLTAIYHL